jgi:hypothetical protein
MIIEGFNRHVFFDGLINEEKNENRNNKEPIRFGHQNKKDINEKSSKSKNPNFLIKIHFIKIKIKESSLLALGNWNINQSDL